MQRDVLVVGNGPAAWGAVSAFRAAGALRRVAVVAPVWPAVSVPGMSQAVMNRTPFHKFSWQRRGAWGCEVWTGAVEVVNPSDQTCHWTDPWQQPVQCRWQHLILATGTRPRPLKLPNWHGPLLRFHHRADMDGWRALQPGTRLLIYGGGLVGAEMVEMGVYAGCEVHWAMREARIWESQFAPEASAQLWKEAREHGVTVHFNVQDLEGFVDASAPNAIGVAIGGVRQDFGVKPTENLRFAGDVSGEGSGWAWAMAHGKATADALLSNRPSVAVSTEDFPFRSSFFRLKLSA